MNISILVILKDFILFCEENNITEPTKKDIEKYVAYSHYDIINDENIYDVEYFEEELEKVLSNIFENTVGIPRKEEEEETPCMIEYELLAISKPEKSEKALDELISILKKNNTKITKAETWGDKQLAYPLKKDGVSYQRGFYTDYIFSVEAKNVDETISNIDEILRKTSNVIKFIIVKSI